MWVDPTGLSPQVECSLISFDDLKGFCEQANGNDSDPNTIDARWKFFDRLATYSMAYGIIGGEGYWWAGKMLKTFLDGTITTFDVHLYGINSLARDSGIVRATKIKGPQGASDEPLEINPLLYLFLDDQVIPGLDCKPYTFSDSYTAYSRDTWTGVYPPRPYDRGWWGAFGHIEINATYSHIGAMNLGNYLVWTKVSYQVRDKYEWFPGKQTPFGPPIASSTIFIPHEWELSLVNAGKAYMFDFEITWSEWLYIMLKDDFSHFDILGEQTNIPLE